MYGICKDFLCVNLETVRLKVRRQRGKEVGSNQVTNGHLGKKLAVWRHKTAYATQFGAAGIVNSGFEKCE